MNDTTAEPFSLDVAVKTDKGTGCAHNEDHCGSVVLSTRSALLVVADGNSTTEGGELASERAVTTVIRSFGETPHQLQQIERLVRAVRNANYEIREMALTVPQLGGMSATLTAVSVSDGLMSAAHVGNGRVYLIRDGEMVQLSKDHTVAAEAGRPDEGGGTLTRQLGTELIIPIDLFEIHLLQHDVVVICTDGLHRVLSEEEIVATATTGDAATVCRRLIERANHVGAPDNVSVGVVGVVGPARKDLE